MRGRNFSILDAGDATGGALTASGNMTVPARPGTVLTWNRLALQLIDAQSARVSDAAPSAARALAILHTCMYNAWAAYDDDARQTVRGVAVRLPRAERNAASKAGAMSHAACLVLKTLFPSQASTVDACMAGLGLAPDRRADTFSPAGIGLTQARCMLDAWRQDDALPFAAPIPADAGICTGTSKHVDVDAEIEAQRLHWCRLAHDICARDAYDDDRAVPLYFVLSNALADAELAGVDGAMAAAEVLRSFTGRDRPDGSAAGASGVASFSGIAAQDCLARPRAALASSRQVGAQVFEKARRYWQGKL